MASLIEQAAQRLEQLRQAGAQGKWLRTARYFDAGAPCGYGPAVRKAGLHTLLRVDAEQQLKRGHPIGVVGQQAEAMRIQDHGHRVAQVLRSKLLKLGEVTAGNFHAVNPIHGVVLDFG